MGQKSIYYFLFWISILGILVSCTTHFFRSNYKDANTLIHKTKNLITKPYLKAHLKNGDVCIFKDSWTVDTTFNTIRGLGKIFDFNRKNFFMDSISINLDSVLIFETNKKLKGPENKRILALGILSGLDLIVGLYCASSPKACFGSCPTFYFNEHEDLHYAEAEAFSNAISPSMEYFDIDALDNKSIMDDTFSLYMKNEALETHCVKEIKLLAFPRSKHERIFHSNKNDFYSCGEIYPISNANTKGRDITQSIKYKDHVEYFSLSNQQNLSSKEEILIEFDDIKDASSLGLILNFRQTMMTTYLIYSALGYMGDEVGDIFALQEKINSDRNKSGKSSYDKLENGVMQELGGIEVFQWNDILKSWEYLSFFNETGPIAINKQIIPTFKTKKGSLTKFKIVLNKGLWRIDYVGLAKLNKKVTPIELSPTLVSSNGGVNTSAKNQLTNKEDYLISLPGDVFKIDFALPYPNKDYELFLYSKGYYLEWMRNQWIKEKNLFKLNQMINHPKRYLKKEAKEYKIYEETMEEDFWNSKINTKILSYDDE